MLIQGPGLPIPPAAGGGIVSGVIQILGSLLGIAFGGGAAGQLEQQITQLRDQTAQAMHRTLALLTDALIALGALLGLLHDLWNGLQQWFLGLLKLLRDAMKWLVTVGIPELVKALRNLRKILDDVYRKYIRPTLVYLQLVRKYLAILRLLHVPFARQLDVWLVRIQARIMAPFLYVLRTLNGIGSWINVILTAGGLLQKPVFVNSDYAYLATWVNLWWAGQSSQMGAGAPPTPGIVDFPRSAAQIKLDFDMFVTADAGPIAEAGAASMVTFQSVIAGAPVTPGSFNPPQFTSSGT